MRKIKKRSVVLAVALVLAIGNYAVQKIQPEKDIVKTTLD